MIRYLAEDNEAKLASCQKLFMTIEQGKIQPYTSTIVLLEIYWTMRSLYHQTKEELEQKITSILAMRGLVIVEKTDFRTAFALHGKTGVKLADCLIATQLPKGVALCTYDREFARIPGLKTVTPEEMMLPGSLKTVRRVTSIEEREAFERGLSEGNV